MKILVAPDKFKGTLTAQAAAEAIARGWKNSRPADSLELLPMSDGGDGFGEVMAKLLGAKLQTTMTVDAAHRPLKARWWWVWKSKTAVIESAQVIGLALLPRGKFHPFQLDTFGLGKIFQAANKRGAKKILIGIGGSATNDGGFGLAHSLGWKFLDARGNEIKNWTSLAALETIRKPSLKNVPEIIVAVDVQNPLLGRHGATRIYGPQKGLRPEDLPRAETALKRLAMVCCSGGLRPSPFHRRSQTAATIPGAGAAGGLGFGLRNFFDAKLERGFEIFSRHADLPARIRKADLVITGEGAIDRQTFMGKGVGEIIKLCKALRVPCAALAGKVERVPKRFPVRAIVPGLATGDEAQTKAAFYLFKLAEQVAGEH